jgi:hypothetical protein
VKMAKKPRQYDSAAAVIDLMAANAKGRAGGTGRWSQLYRWLRAHHDQLAQAFGDHGPSWASIAAHLGNIGVMDGEGKQPLPGTVRAAWYRVRRDVAVARASRVEPVAGEPVPGVTFAPQPTMNPPAPPAPVSPPAGDPAPPERRFGMARLKSAPAASPVRNDPPAYGLAGDSDPSPQKFGLARPRGHVPSTPPSPPPVPEPEPIRRTPEEVARIMAEMMSGAPQNPFRRDKGD